MKNVFDFYFCLQFFKEINLMACQPVACTMFIAHRKLPLFENLNLCYIWVRDNPKASKLVNVSLLLTFIFILEPTPSFGQRYHQLRTQRRFNQDWSCRYCSSSSCRCVSSQTCQPSHLVVVHWCPWSQLQKHQIHRWMSCWWAHQRCQGKFQLLRYQEEGRTWTCRQV